MITTTLKDIRDARPCTDGWEKLLNHLDKTGAEAKTDETLLPVLTVLESNGLDDALWVLDNAVGNKYLCRLFAADCAEKVLHLFEDVMPNDTRPRDAIAVARDLNSTAAARDAARDAAWAAAWAAAWDAARAAAWAAAGDAAGAAAARAAARDAQEKRLRQYLEHGEAAKDMEWG